MEYRQYPPDRQKLSQIIWRKSFSHRNYQILYIVLGPSCDYLLSSDMQHEEHNEQKENENFQDYQIDFNSPDWIDQARMAHHQIYQEHSPRTQKQDLI